MSTGWIGPSHPYDAAGAPLRAREAALLDTQVRIEDAIDAIRLGRVDAGVQQLVNVSRTLMLALYDWGSYPPTAPSYCRGARVEARPSTAHRAEVVPGPGNAFFYTERWRS